MCVLGGGTSKSWILRRRFVRKRRFVRITGTLEINLWLPGFSRDFHLHTSCFSLCSVGEELWVDSYYIVPALSSGARNIFVGTVLVLLWLL